MNILLNYLYRDGANYKQYDAAIFSNVSGLSVAAIDAAIKKHLVEGEWFYANKWGLKDLHVYKWDSDIDHEWHEYESVEETEQEVTNGPIVDFLVLIAN